MDAGKSHAVADDFVPVRFAVDPDAVAQRARRPRPVQKHVVDAVEDVPVETAGELGQSYRFGAFREKFFEPLPRVVHGAGAGGGGVAERQLRHAGEFALRAEQRAVAAVGYDQPEAALGLLESEFPQQRTDVVEIFSQQFDLHFASFIRIFATTAYSIAAAALPTLIDSLRPAIGSSTMPSQSSSVSGATPSASLPSTSAIGNVYS